MPHRDAAADVARPAPRLVRVIVALLAVALQCQITLRVGGEVRVSSADLLMPLIVGGLAVQALQGRLGWPAWRLRHLLLWIVVLSVVMTYALVLGRIYLGEWTSWALVNKFAGWFALIGYLGIGAVLVSRFGESVRTVFVVSFVVMAWIVCSVESLDITLRTFSIMPAGLLPRRDFAFTGLMVNSNAFGFLMLAAICLQLAYVAHDKFFAPRQLHRVGLCILLIGLFYSHSHATWIAALVALVLLIWYRRALALEFAIAGACTVLFIMAIDHLPGAFHWVSGGAPGRWSYNSGLMLAPSPNEFNRIELSLDALKLWLAHPVFGAGLGRHLAVQAAQSSAPLTIHNTGLWLLAETGLVGAVAFTAFFIVCLLALGRNVSSAGPFVLATLVMLVAMGVISAFHEPMYQRYIWVLLGMALVYAKQIRLHSDLPAPTAVDRHST